MPGLRSRGRQRPSSARRHVTLSCRRFDRGIQYARPLDLSLTPLEYWITRSRVMTVFDTATADSRQATAPTTRSSLLEVTRLVVDADFRGEIQEANWHGLGDGLHQPR